MTIQIKNYDLETEVIGQTWSTAEMQNDFTVTGFAAPFAIVTRKKDGAKGSLEFKHNPRLYFNFKPDLS